jgi:hypothetical protein
MLERQVSCPDIHVFKAGPGWDGVGRQRRNDALDNQIGKVNSEMNAYISELNVHMMHT